MRLTSPRNEDANLQIVSMEPLRAANVVKLFGANAHYTLHQ